MIFPRVLVPGRFFKSAGDLYSSPDKYDDLAGKEGLFAMQANRLGVAALARAVSEEFGPADYSFVVKRRGNPPKPWRWEIYCACKAVPIERSPIFFESMSEATKAGKKALAHLLAAQLADVRFRGKSGHHN
ncbi:MAG: hypothetical protein WB503_23010 [Pseudolabrys sp.]